MKTKIIVLIAALLFIVAIVNPPWRVTIKDSKGHTKRTELVWAYLGDVPNVHGEYYQSAGIAADILTLQLLCLGASAATALFLMQPRKHK